MRKIKHFFNLESKMNKSGEQLIFFNLSYGQKKYNVKSNTYRYEPLRISTGYNIKKEFWIDKPTYRANKEYVSKFGRKLNDELANIEKTGHDQLSIFTNTFNREPSVGELKKIMLEKLDRIEKDNIDICISEYIEQLIDKRTKLPDTSSEFWSTKTGNQYKAVSNRVRRYEVEKKINLTFGGITEHLYWDYFKTINDFQKKDSGEYYTQTTINKEFRSLRAIFNCANDDDIIINIAYSKKKLKIPASPSSYETYLSDEQLRTIINFDTSHSKEFQNAKNYIILSSFTGLRISDMVHLHEIKPEIIYYKSKEYNCFTTRIRKSKDNTQELITIIPILKPVKEILESNGNKFPKFTSEPNIRKVISKFLKHLKFEKEVETKTKYFYVNGFKTESKKQYELFSPHDCRRTFITNLKQLSLQNDTIEPITHPKIDKDSVLGSYDKSTLPDNAIKFIKQLNSKKSSLYKH